MYLIAEIGQNHQGLLSIAKKMVDQLEGSGVHAVKTAKRDINSFPEDWKNQPYATDNSFGKTYYEHRCALELSNEDFKELASYAVERGFDFISSFTDKASFDFLYNEVKPKYYKICSSRVADIGLLMHVAEHDVDTILSTGMSDLQDVITAEKILSPLVTMQCTSSYPCKWEDLNLNIIDGLNINGFSGHHEGIFPDLIAYTKGAEYIERHFTLDKTWKGSDHKCSLTVNEFQELVEKLEVVDEILGVGVKNVLDCEKEAIQKLRYDLHN